MRKLLWIFAVALMAFAAYVALADCPETMTIDDCANKKAPVEFPHKAHFAVAACIDCHHTSEGLTAENAHEMTVDPCSKCHNEPEKAETPKCSESSKKTNHYHINCIGCHKDAMEKNAELKLPAKCTECHPKPAAEG